VLTRFTIIFLGTVMMAHLKFLTSAEAVFASTEAVFAGLGVSLVKFGLSENLLESLLMYPEVLQLAETLSASRDTSSLRGATVPFQLLAPTEGAGVGVPNDGKSERPLGWAVLVVGSVRCDLCFTYKYNHNK
jgi:hypothetical protein